MGKIKSNLTNMALVLTGSALICGGLLAYTNHATEPTIEAQSQKTLNEGISAVLGGDAGKSIAAPDTVKRSVAGKEQTFIIYKMEKGTAVQSTDPNGFGGPLTVLVGFNDNGDIQGYTVLQHAETPGLGAKAGDWFQEGQPGNIIGKNPSKVKLTVSKDGGDIDAITASTITSRSFLRAVQEAYNTFSGQEVDGNTSATAKKNEADAQPEDNEDNKTN